MNLQIGTSLGSYQIQSALGAGGMGEVYLAHDAKLRRNVAIKILPEAFAHDADRLSRFEREARILASLNHPNIAAIYDLAEFEQIRFLVLEFVPGETISAIISRGPVPWPEALRLGSQIAEALVAAHGKGIVHRDLKPANILVTPEGRAKVLDFGLAKGYGVTASMADSSHLPTVLEEQTEQGTILGTATYMSPEQARGKPTDQRSDLWSFGCILYELLTGQRAFDGETLSDKIAAILVRDPDWSALPPDSPEKVRALLRLCLEKNLDRRLSDAGAVKALVDEALAIPLESAGRRQTAIGFGKRFILPLAVVVALLIAITLWQVLKPRHSSDMDIPEKKYMVVLPFKDLSGQTSGQLVGDGMVETLTARLGRVPEIQLVVPSAAIAASDKQADPFRAANSLGANLLVQGSVQRSGGLVRVTYSVWNTQRPVVIGGGTVDGPAGDLFGIQDRLADEVINSLKVSSQAAARKPEPSGLETAGEQERYLRALGNLQRYDKDSAVNEAVALLGALATEKPAVAMVHAALGRAYLFKFNQTRDKKWVELAVSACAQAQRLNPASPDVDVTFGEVRLASGQAGEAIAAFQRALSAQPNNYSALLGLAAAYNGAGKTSEAESTYHRALALQPSYWAGYSKSGGFYINHGNYHRAAEMFRRVTELSPDNARAFGNLGAAYQLMGDFEKALAAYKQSLALAPTSLAYSNIGTLQFFSNRPKEAAEAFESALRLSPQHFQLWANLADAYRWTPEFRSRAAGTYAKAIELCYGELKLNPNAGHVHSTLALCLAKTGSLREAEEHIGKALAADSRNPQYLYHAAIVANLAHKTNDALASLALATGNGYPKSLAVRDPEFVNLRSAPAFQEATRNHN